MEARARRSPCVPARGSLETSGQEALKGKEGARGWRIGPQGGRGAVGSRVEARTGLSTTLLHGGPGTGPLLGLPFSDPAPCLKESREPTEKTESQRQASPGLLDRCPDKAGRSSPACRPACPRLPPSALSRVGFPGAL